MKAVHHYAILLSFSLPSWLSGAERAALVIGNAAYAHAGALANPVTDARAVSQRLSAAGYDVTSVEDGGIQKLYAGLRQFCEKAKGAEVALFFFAGHGIEAKGENYLLPVDAVLAEEGDLDLQALALERVLNDMAKTRSVLKVIVLDCCRNNPLAKSRGWMKRSRSLSGGLAEVGYDKLAEGTMLVFSGAPGREVPDGVGQAHSPFATAFLKQMGTPGTSLAGVFSGVAVQIADQEPWIRFDGSGRSFASFSQYPLIPGAAPAVSGTSAPAEAQARDKELADMKALVEKLTAESTGRADQAKEIAALKAQVAAMAKEQAGKKMAHPPVSGPPEDGVGAQRDDLAKGAIGDTRGFDLAGDQRITVKYVPGGEFLMGSPPTEKDREESEGQVKVTLSSHFWMAETEVTMEQWEAVMGSARPARFEGENLPVIGIDWDYAQEFVFRLNAKHPLLSGWKWTLPTEAQWERACRGGTETAFSFGADETEISRYGNIGSFISEENEAKGERPADGFGRSASPAKTFLPNGYGLYDMHGNVWEWCLDRYAEVQTGGIDPQGPPVGEKRAFRGGSWFNASQTARSASRGGDVTHSIMAIRGFRVAIARIAPAREGEPGELLREGTVGDARSFTIGEEERVTMRFVPGGEFLMGSPEDEVKRRDDEGQVKVTLSSHFWMGVSEVTQQQWEAVMGENPSEAPERGNPVEMVSRNDAQKFVDKLNATSKPAPGWRWALPTEAQWERACRGGENQIFGVGYRGNALDSSEANFLGLSPYGEAEAMTSTYQPLSVRCFDANDYGLYDMHGNVREWCLDGYDAVLPGGIDPKGSKSAEEAVLRGGSCITPGWECRSAFRGSEAPGHVSNDIGVRLAIVRE